MNQNQTKSGLAAAVAAALIVLIVKTLGHYGITVDEDTRSALFTLLVAGACWLAHFDRAPKAPTPEDRSNA